MARSLAHAASGGPRAGAVPGNTLTQVTPAQAAYLTGRGFFPQLVSGAFQAGISEAFHFATAAALLAACFSWMRGSAPAAAAGLDASRPGRRGSLHC